MRVLVLSDTHGRLRPEVEALAAGAELVLHAGDVGDPAVLDRLNALAPTLAVRGNVDRGPWAAALPPTLLHEAGGAWVYVLHDLADLDLSPGAAGVRVVVSGHSHVPKAEERDGVLYLNPGSCGPRRFRLPVSAAWLDVSDGEVRVDWWRLGEESDPG